MKIEIFGEEYNQIIRKKDKGIDVSKDILNYVRNTLKETLEIWNNIDSKTKERISEEIAGIPIKLFHIENTDIEKDLKKIITQLVDMEGNKSMKEIDRKSLIEKVYSELKNYSE